MNNDGNQPPRKPRGWLRYFVRARRQEAPVNGDADVPAEPEPEERSAPRKRFSLFTRKRARKEPGPLPIETLNGVEERAPVEADEPPRRPRATRPIFFRVRERISPIWKTSLALLPFIVFLAWWVWATQGVEVEARRISPTVLPSPSEVLGHVRSVWFDSALMRNILVSLGRALGGLAAAAVIALPLGVAMASFGRVGATFGLITTLLSYVPMPAIVPLTMIWWGTGEKQKIGFLAVGTFAYLLPLVVRRINAVEHKYLLSAYSQGARPWQVVTRVLIPIALPGIYDALRLCLGIGWTYIMLAELIRADEDLGGVGSLLMIFRRLNDPEGVYITLAAVLLVGAILDRLAAWIGKQLFPYRASTARD